MDKEHKNALLKRSIAPMRFTTQNGFIEIENPEFELQLLAMELKLRVEADALQRALSTVYRVGGEPDPSRPWNGLLTERLDISERTARALITEGRLPYTCLGKKNYRVTEQDVRKLLSDKQYIDLTSLTMSG
jgi:excisionase family DNA binding protein